MIGFIGSGNMAQAMFGGMVKNGYPADKIMIADKDEEKLTKNKQRFGVRTTQDIRKTAQCEIVVLAVKPFHFEQVIEEIRDVVTAETVIVSVAAGITLSQMFEWFGQELKIIRAMPNTPALVGEGMSALVPGARVSQEELGQVRQIFDSFGKSEVVAESALHGVIAVSGSSPAYVYLFIEAMADAAVKEGIAREQAYEMASQSVLGAAKIVLETGQHPGALKDAVCSPGGTTIEAVIQLEKSGFRQSVMSAMEACAEKSRQMSGSQ